MCVYIYICIYIYTSMAGGLQQLHLRRLPERGAAARSAFRGGRRDSHIYIYIYIEREIMVICYDYYHYTVIIIIIIIIIIIVIHRGCCEELDACAQSPYHDYPYQDSLTQDFREIPYGHESSKPLI